jgi:hypothetical protein
MTDGDHIILSIPKGRVQATCIHVWKRGDGSRWIMNTSSGPKDNFVNDALTLLEKHSDVEAVALMSLPGPGMCYLLQETIDGRWRDIAGVYPQMVTL